MPLDFANLTPDQQAVADEIRSGPRGGLRGPFEAWLHSPDLASRAQRLGEYCRFQTTLAKDANELAILLAGKHWRAQFEFWAHTRLGRDAGLPAEVIEAIRTGEQPALSRPDLQAVYDVITEYFATNRVSGETYRRVVGVLGERGLIDVIGVVGYYGLVSMTLNIAEVGLPEGETPPFD